MARYTLVTVCPWVVRRGRKAAFDAPGWPTNADAPGALDRGVDHGPPNGSRLVDGETSLRGDDAFVVCAAPTRCRADRHVHHPHSSPTFFWAERLGERGNLSTPAVNRPGADPLEIDLAGGVGRLDLDARWSIPRPNRLSQPRHRCSEPCVRPFGDLWRGHYSWVGISSPRRYRGHGPACHPFLEHIAAISMPTTPYWFLRSQVVRRVQQPASPADAMS